MGIVLGICSAVFAITTIGLLIKLVAVNTDNEDKSQKITALRRENKKLQGQQSSRSEKYSKTANEASKRSQKFKDQQNKLDRVQRELNTQTSELEKSESRVRELSSELNRVRVDRETIRAKSKTLEEQLAAAKRASSKRVPAPAEAPQTSEAADEVESTEEASEAQAAPARSHRVDRVVEKLEARVKSLKKGLIEREAALRAVRRKNEHNRRAYIITQLQLDLAQDEVYVLTHGTPPPFKQADKQTKRASLEPKKVEIVANLDADPIELIGVGDNLPIEDDDSVESTELLNDIAETDDDSMGSNVTDETTEDASPSDDGSDGELAAEDDQVTAEDTAPSEQADAGPEQEGSASADDSSDDTKEVAKKSTTRLRKTARKQAEDADEGASNADANQGSAAPPRPNLKP